MIDIDKFIKFVKSTWVRHLITDFDSPWTKIINHKYNVADNLISLCPAWCKYLCDKITNHFWKDVINAWQAVAESCLVRTLDDLLNTPLWYNKHISKSTLYYPKWHEKEIRFLRNFLSERNAPLPMEDLKKKYHLQNINYLEYYREKLLVKCYLSKNKQKVHESERSNCPLPHFSTYKMQERGTKFVQKFKSNVS